MKPITFNPNSEFDLLPLQKKANLGENIPGDKPYVRNRINYGGVMNEWMNGEPSFSEPPIPIEEAMASEDRVKEGVEKGILQVPYNYEGTAEQYHKLQSSPSTNWMPETSKPKNINWGNLIAGGLTAVNSLIPEKKAKPPVVKPLNSQNPLQYGKASDAIYEFGGTIEDPEKPKKFKNSVEKQKYWDSLVPKYGEYVKDRQAWTDIVNSEFRPEMTRGDKNLLNASKNISKSYNIRPELLAASILEEGGQQSLKNKDNQLMASEAWMNAAGKQSSIEKYGVDGFLQGGLDRFGELYPTFVKKGYLKEDFKESFTPYEAINEKKEKVTTAAFKDYESMIQAKGAFMAYERDGINEYAKKKGITLSPEAQEFFSLAAYNGGAGNAQKMLEEYNRQGLLKGNKFLNQKPSSYQGIYANVMKRIQGANMLKGEGVFADGGFLPGLSDSFSGSFSSVMEGGVKKARHGRKIEYLENEVYELDDKTINSLLDDGYELQYI
jgi:hypothetical protein